MTINGIGDYLTKELENEINDDGPLRVMAVTFGPPELAETFGGALANFSMAGHKVILVAMCLFLPEVVLGKEYNLTDEEQLKNRMDDFQRMSKILGAEKFIHVGYSNNDWGTTLKGDEREPLSKLMTIIRQERPHIVLCPDYYYDYNPGKIGTAELVKKACYMSGYEHEFREDSENGIEPWCVRRMYFADIEFGDSGDAKHTHYIDITDSIDTKIKALQACSLEATSLAYTSLHVGQYTPRLGLPINLKSACKIIGADYDVISKISDDQERWLQLGKKIFEWELTRRAIRRGMECGVPYAEAYRMWHPANLYSPTKLLQHK